MTERDELARDLFLADNSSFPEGEAEKDWDENRENHDYAYAIADGLIARGYRRPRTITTAEELDALPNKSIILEIDGTPTRAVKRQDGKNWWIDSPMGMSASALIPLPATVLYEPEQP